MGSQCKWTSESLGLGGDLDPPWLGLDQNSWATLGSHGALEVRVGTGDLRAGTWAKALEKAVDRGLSIGLSSHESL